MEVQVSSEDRLGELEFVGFGKRVQVVLLDLLVCLPFLFVSHWVQQWSFRVWSPVPTLVCSSVQVAVWIWCISRLGGSPGKLLMKMKVVDRQGKYLSLAGSLIRNWDGLLNVVLLALDFAIIFSAEAPTIRPQSSSEMADYFMEHETIYGRIQFAMAFYTILDVLVVRFQAQKRAIHDLLAGSYVVTDQSLEAFRRMRGERVDVAL